MNTNARYAVGVDVGGTKLAVAVIDREGAAPRKIKLPVAKESVAASVRQIVEAIYRAVEATAISWGQVAGIGVGIPGIYFAESGKAWAPNLWGWEQIALRDELCLQLPAPVTIDSDRAAYVLGEQWLGAARGLSDVVFLAVGTGIGAGIITGGRLCRGAGNIAGAVGWFALDPCQKEIYQQMGCLEAEAAGPAVARRVVAYLSAGEESVIHDLAGGDTERVTTEIVVDAARRGDALARRVLEEAASYLGMGVANIISILNPQMVVLGGGLMQAGELLLEPLRREALRRAQPLAAEQARIELSHLGEDAGLLGAARLAFLRQTGNEI